MELIIAPSILSADFGRLAEQVKMVEEAGARWLHIDVMDGHFVPNLTVGPALVNSIRKYTSLFFDVHLMVEHPIKFVKPFCDAGADCLTFHIEAKDDPLATIDAIKKQGIKAGISLNPPTAVETIFPYLQELDLVLVMTVNPGFAGQKFIDSAAEKIKIIRTKQPTLNISVDGGINYETGAKALQLGANILAAGSFIFDNSEPAAVIKNMLNLKEKV